MIITWLGFPFKIYYDFVLFDVNYNNNIFIPSISEPTSKPRSGKQTSEYTRVRQNLDAITQVLDMNSDANQRLRQKFQKERWLSVGSDTGGEQLVTVALSRIENDAGQFQQFVDMLNDIDGMDLIVKKLTGRYYIFICIT